MFLTRATTILVNNTKTLEVWCDGWYTKNVENLWPLCQLYRLLRLTNFKDQQTVIHVHECINQKYSPYRIKYTIIQSELTLLCLTKQELTN